MKKAKKIIAHIYRLHKPFRKVIGVVLFFLISGQVVFLARPFLQGKIIDALTKHESLPYLLLLTASLFGVYLLANILDYFREYFEWKELYYDLERFIRLDTLTQLSRFSIGQHSNEHSGLRQSTINQGKDAVRRLSEHFTYTLFPMLLQVTLATTVILLTNWQVGVVILIASLLYIYLLFTHNMRFYPLMKKNTDDFQKLVKKESEIIRHFSLIKAEAQEQSIIKEYFDGVIPVEEFGKQIWIGHSKVYHSYQAFIELAQVGALFMGIVLVTQGYTTPGTVVALFGWISSVFGNLGNIGWMQRQVIQQVASIDRYMETLSLPEPKTATPTPGGMDMGY
jgi:ABC-type multidrug transport system fused ATPase/permease subunit